MSDVFCVIMSHSATTSEQTQDPLEQLEDREEEEEENEENSKETDEEKKEDERTKALRVYLAKVLNLPISPNRVKKALNARHIMRIGDGSEVAYARLLLEIVVQLMLHTYNITRETSLSGAHILSAAASFTPMNFLSIKKACVPIQTLGNQKEELYSYLPVYSYPFKQTVHPDEEIVYERYHSKKDQIEALFKKSMPNSKQNRFGKFHLSFDSVLSSKSKKKVDMYLQDNKFVAKLTVKDKKAKNAQEKTEKVKKGAKTDASPKPSDEEESEQLTKKKRKREPANSEQSKKKEEEPPKKKSKVDKPSV